MMEFSNTLNQAWQAGEVDANVWRESIRGLVLMMAPITPFLAEELWGHVGGEYSVHQQSWPEWDEDLAADETITLVVQVNGRLRHRIEVPADVSEEYARSVALKSARIRQFTEGKTIRRVIYVPGRLVNVVATKLSREGSRRLNCLVLCR